MRKMKTTPTLSDYPLIIGEVMKRSEIRRARIARRRAIIRNQAFQDFCFLLLTFALLCMILSMCVYTNLH
jgi:hypothetical protein